MSMRYQAMTVACVLLASCAVGGHEECVDDDEAPDKVVQACTRTIARTARAEDISIALHIRGNAWTAKGDIDRAIADYDEAIRLNPRNVFALSNLGNAWSMKGDVDHAIAAFTAAIRVDPRFAIAFYNRGNSWRVGKRDYDRAIADYDEAIRLDQRFAKAFNNRGAAWSAKGDVDRAIADYDEAIRLDPRDPQFFNDRATEWWGKDDNDRAIADFSEAIRRDPRMASALMGRGFSYFMTGQFASAAKDLRDANQLRPDVYTALWLYLSQARDGRNAAAELAADPSARRTTDWPRSVVLLFLGKLRPGDVLAAAADPDAVTMRNQRCEAMFYLGEWHLLRNDRPAASASFREARESCPRAFLEYHGAVAELNAGKR